MISQAEIPNIAIGTRIIVTGDFGSLAIVEVERTTQTMIVLSNGTKIHKKNGDIVGKQPYSRSSVELGTPEKIFVVKIEIKKRNLIRKINAFERYEDLSIGALEGILLLIDSADKGEKQ